MSRRTLQLPEATGVPEFVRRVSSLFDLFFVEPDILAVRGDPHQTESKTIGSILRDQVQRVRRIAETFRHFSPLKIADDPGEKNVFERDRSLIFEARHNHPGDPKEDDV